MLRQSIFIALLSALTVHGHLFELEVDRKPIAEFEYEVSSSRCLQLAGGAHVELFIICQQAASFGDQEYHLDFQKFVKGWPELMCVADANTSVVVRDAIVLAMRGGCSFVQKAAVAQKAGAKAVVLGNYDVSFNCCGFPLRWLTVSLLY